MSVYNSKFATRNVVPSVGRDHRHLKRFALGVVVLAVVTLSAFGLWRATIGVPGPGQYPAVIAE